MYLRTLIDNKIQETIYVNMRISNGSGMTGVIFKDRNNYQPCPQ